MNNFKVIYKILKALEASLDSSIFDEGLISPALLGISAERRNALLLMMQEDGLITGVKEHRYLTGDSELLLDRPKITIKGLQFLEENSLIQKIKSAVKTGVDIAT